MTHERLVAGAAAQQEAPQQKCAGESGRRKQQRGQQPSVFPQIRGEFREPRRTEFHRAGADAGHQPGDDAEQNQEPVFAEMVIQEHHGPQKIVAVIEYNPLLAHGHLLFSSSAAGWNFSSALI